MWLPPPNRTLFSVVFIRALLSHTPRVSWTHLSSDSINQTLMCCLILLSTVSMYYPSSRSGRLQASVCVDLVIQGLASVQTLYLQVQTETGVAWWIILVCYFSPSREKPVSGLPVPAVSHLCTTFSCSYCTTYCYLRQGGYVMPGICLSVCLSCLLATLRKNCWTGLREHFTTDVSVDKEELITFWKSSASGSRNFLKDSSTLRDKAFFHDLAYISGESDRIFI